MKIKNLLYDAIGAFRVQGKRRKAIKKASPVSPCADPLKEKVLALHPGLVKATVIAIERLPSSYVRIRFQLPAPFIMVPGTYCVVYARVGKSVASRAYSPSSSPSLAKQGILEIIVFPVPHGFFSTYLCTSLNVGDNCHLTLNNGHLFFDMLRDTPSFVCIAGGGALTPFLSMAKALNEKPDGRKMKLFVGAHTSADLIDPKELAEVASPHVEVIKVYDDEVVEGAEHGFITADILSRHGCLADQTYFLCGRAPMMDFVQKELLSMGVEQKRIHFENSDPIPYEAPVDKKVSILVHQGDKAFNINASTNESLLVSLERNGFVIPTSCRHGECGACRIEVINGSYAISQEKDGRRYGDKLLNVVHGCVTYPLEDLEIRIPILTLS